MQEGTNIQQYLKMIDAKERPQPYILLVGGSRWKPGQVFVVIERQEIECSSVMQAVDICFKLTYILDIDYQPLCRTTWQLLQHMVYELSPSPLTGASLINFRTWLTNQPPLQITL